MKPLRHEREQQLDQAPWSRQPHLGQQQQTDHVIDDDGAIASEKTGRRFAGACGCLKPPGGFCGVCGSPVCEACFRHCGQCRKPLCPRHCRVTAVPNAAPLWLCAECHSAVERHSLTRRVVRGFLSIFVELPNP